MSNVTRITDDGMFKDWAVISPDGTKLIYCEKKTENGLWDIMLLRDVASPAKTTLLKDGFAPAWYENNSTFMYVQYTNNNYRLIRSTISGGGKTYVTRNASGFGESRPSVRDGIVLCNTMEDRLLERQLVSMKDNGTEYTFLGMGWSPSWHPIENKFLFVREGNLYEMDVESTQVSELFNDPDYNCAMPRYSGDGQYILFQKGAEVKVTATKETGVISGLLGKVFKKKETVVSKGSNWQIFYMKADGTGHSQLTSGDVSAYSPSWDKNNNVYFVANANGKEEVYRARVNIIE
ncbi:MAG: hypothetical protein LBR99_03905 [Treponema sp.]|nr:hypothetical protein [Treponema sp.]